MAIGPHANAWDAFCATSRVHIPADGSGGNFAEALPGGVSVCAQHVPVGSGSATFLFQSLYLVPPIIDNCDFLSRPFPILSRNFA